MTAVRAVEHAECQITAGAAAAAARPRVQPGLDSTSLQSQRRRVKAGTHQLAAAQPVPARTRAPPLAPTQYGREGSALAGRRCRHQTPHPPPPAPFDQQARRRIREQPTAGQARQATRVLLANNVLASALAKGASTERLSGRTGAGRAGQASPAAASGTYTPPAHSQAPLTSKPKFMPSNASAASS